MLVLELNSKKVREGEERGGEIGACGIGNGARTNAFLLDALSACCCCCCCRWELPELRYSALGDTNRYRKLASYFLAPHRRDPNKGALTNTCTYISTYLSSSISICHGISLVPWNKIYNRLLLSIRIGE